MSFLSLNVLKLSVLLFLVGGIIFALAKSLKEVLFKNKKKLFLYLFIILLSFFTAGLFTIKALISGSLVFNNILIQVWLLLTGIVHILLGFKFFNWGEGKKNVHFFVFTLVVGLIGSIVFLNTVKYLGLNGLQYFFWTGIVMFFLPFLLKILIDVAFLVPIPIYDKWYYPDKRKLARPDKEELRNPILITLELEKKAEGSTSRIKAKAPENMTFGRFFYHFVNDYNLHNPEKPIAISDDNGNNFGWGFYTKRGFLRGWDSVKTDNTILHNRLSENQIIVCECFDVDD